MGTRFSLTEDETTGRGLSLKIKRRMKLMMVRMPKKMKHPSHPNEGRIRLLATMPMFAAIALAKYKIEYTFDPSL